MEVLDGYPGRPRRRSKTIPVVSPDGVIKVIVAQPDDMKSGHWVLPGGGPLRWSADLEGFMINPEFAAQGWALLKDLCDADGEAGAEAWGNYQKAEEARKRDHIGVPKYVLRGTGIAERCSPPSVLERRRQAEKRKDKEAGLTVDDIFGDEPRPKAKKRGAK